MAIQETVIVGIIEEDPRNNERTFLEVHSVETIDGFRPLRFGLRLTEKLARELYPEYFFQASAADEEAPA